jgi:hypothetical protein
MRAFRPSWYERDIVAVEALSGSFKSEAAGDAATK